MTIQDQLRLLYQLSQLDHQISEIRLKNEHIPVRRREIEQLIAEKGEGRSSLQTRIAQLETEQRGLEGEWQTSQERLREFEARMNQLKSNREYQAALKEISEIKRSSKEMEEKRLKIAAEIAPLQEELKKSEETWDGEQTRLNEELGGLGKEVEQIEQEILVIEGKKRELFSGIEPNYLAHYRRVQETRSPAVTLADQGICHACNMKIPPQLFIEIQKFAKFPVCPSCKRILYLSI